MKQRNGNAGSSEGAEMSFAISGIRTRMPSQFKAILPAEIIKALAREHLSVRAAHGRTG